MYKIIKLNLILIIVMFLSYIAQATTKLASDVDGYQVKFLYDKYEKERNIAYQHLVNAIQEADMPIDKKLIGIDFYDLDDNGNPEILIYLKQKNYCAIVGCPFEMMTVKNNKYTAISFGPVHMFAFDNVLILPQKTNQFHDICFNNKTIWRWRGEYYFFSERKNLKKTAINKQAFLKFTPYDNTNSSAREKSL